MPWNPRWWTCLGGVLRATGGNLAAIYDLTSDGWGTPLIARRNGGASGQNFTLQAGQGYLLYSDAAGSYTPGTAGTAGADPHAVAIDRFPGPPGAQGITPRMSPIPPLPTSRS